MHKYTYLLALALSLFCSDVFGQESRNELYVYRNDGAFNAFFCADIDSITFSCIDIDSTMHDEPLVQEIWTADSVCRIPLSSIDSISFHPLETKYNPNVIRLDPMLPHLAEVDSMTLSFSSTLPSWQCAKVGDILLYESFSDQFPTGFAGKVVSVSDTDGFTYVCDSVGIDEVYDQILMFDEYTVEPDEANPSQLRLVSRKAGRNAFNIGLKGKYSIDDFELSFNGSCSPVISATMKREPGKPFYIDVRTNIGTKVNVGFKGKILHASKTFEWAYFPVIPPIPIPGCPMVQFKLDARPFIKMSGDIDVSFDYDYGSTFTMSVSKNESGFSFSKSYTTTKNDFSATMNLDGKLSGGLIFVPHFTCVGGMFRIGLKAQVGPAFDAKIKCDLVDDLAGRYYDEFKDSRVKLSADATISAEASVKLWKLNASKVFASYTYSLPLWTRYLFPEFTKPQVDGDDIYNVVATTTPQRDLLFPVKIGMEVYDSQHNLAERSPETVSYRLRRDWPYERLTTFFTQLTTNEPYTVTPYIELFGHHLVASPQTEVELQPESQEGLRAVDLGLSVKWANCNVGASYPEDPGNFYAWGETEVKDSYDDIHYTWYKDGSHTQITKYCHQSLYGYNWYVDTLTTLEPDDDVAHVKLGKKWRMPTREELAELAENCDWIKILNDEQTSLKGYLLRSKINGKSIFLPTPGYAYGTKIDNLPILRYWSSSLNKEESTTADYLFFQGNYDLEPEIIGFSRSDGLPVRAVCPR